MPGVAEDVALMPMRAFIVLMTASEELEQRLLSQHYLTSAILDVTSLWLPPTLSTSRHQH